MSAGQPDWQKLAELGKLPKDKRHLVAGLAQIDDMEAKLKLALSLMTKEQKEQYVEKVREMRAAEVKATPPPTAAVPVISH
jgi:hypothetical protein